MNQFSAIGRVGRDAVTRYTQGGKAVASWSLAVDDGWGDNKTTVWLDCSLWGDRNEKLAPHITKGVQLGVTGSIGTREHDGKTYVTLRVSDVTLIGGRSEGDQRGTSSTGSRGGAPQRQRPARATSQNVADAEFGDSIPFATNRSSF